MNQSEHRSERLLHAYVDGELSSEEKKAVLSRLESDEAFRMRAGELQRTKEWVRFSFEDEHAPSRKLPAARSHRSGDDVIRVTASVALLLVVFAAGWFAHGLHQRFDRQVLLETAVEQSRHVILHIGESNDALFTTLLHKTETILDRYSSQGIQVEVVANAGGLDLFRTSVSPHVEGIRRLIANYPNVRFIACSRGLERLRARGKDDSLIKGVYADEPAADHLIARLSEGWELVRL